jgi:cell division protein FtsW
MLAMGLTLGMALALTRRRPGAYGVANGPAMSGAALA